MNPNAVALLPEAEIDEEEQFKELERLYNPEQACN
jgi:hypothetical protein